MDAIANPKVHSWKNKVAGEKPMERRNRELVHADT